MFDEMIDKCQPFVKQKRKLPSQIPFSQKKHEKNACH